MFQRDVFLVNDDPNTPVRFMVDLSEDHFLTHEGYTHSFYTDKLDLDYPNTFDILIRTGVHPLHIIVNLEVYGGLARGHMYRAPTVTSEGTEIAFNPFNDLTHKAHPMEAKAFINPTISNVGTAILPPNGRLVLSPAQGSKAISSSVRAAYERVWRPNTYYLIRQVPEPAVVDLMLVITGAGYEEEV